MVELPWSLLTASSTEQARSEATEEKPAAEQQTEGEGEKTEEEVSKLLEGKKFIKV